MFDDVYYPPPAFHFRVDFTLFPSMSGYSFKEVSGIEAKMEIVTILEGGENGHEHRVPGRTTYENLVLKRGFVDSMASPLVAWIMSTIGTSYTLSIVKQPIIVSLLGDDGSPIASWSFWNCYPVRWAVGELDSENTDSVLMEEIEFCYSSWSRIPTFAMKAYTGDVNFMGEISEKIGESKALNFVSDKISGAVDSVTGAIEDGIKDAADGILTGIEKGVDKFDESLGFDPDEDDEETEQETPEEDIEETEETDTDEVNDTAEEEAEEEETEEEDEESSDSTPSDEADGTDNTGIGSGGGGGDKEPEDEDEDEEAEEDDDQSDTDENDQK